MTIAQRVLFFCTSFCFVLSVIVHGASFLDIPFYPALFMVPLLFIIWPLVVWQWRRVPKTNLVSGIFGAIPLWMKIATGLLFAYVFFNFFSCQSILLGGMPVKLEDGRLVLQKGNEILKELDQAGFVHAAAVQSRMLSGNLLAFYGLALVALRALHIKSSAFMANVKVHGN